jgi:hypothetical protein
MIPDNVKSLCDTLEWLLVPWGHKHRGYVSRSAINAPYDAPVWSNKRPEFLPGPEAELHIVTWPDGRVAFTTGGDSSWALDARGEITVRLCETIAQKNYTIQKIKDFGVLLTPMVSP